MQKKQIVLALILSFVIVSHTFGQSVGIGTPSPDAKAILELQSSTQGFLPPRVSTAVRTGSLQTGMGMAQAGLFVYDTNVNSYYYWDGTQWVQLGGGSANAWALVGNAISNGQFLGTTNNQALRVYTNNLERGRFLSDGRFIYNSLLAPFPFDRFSVYGEVSETAVSGYGGAGAPGIFGQGDLNGVLGISTAQTGVGTIGVGDDTDQSWGVYGQSLRISNGAGVVGTGNAIDPAITLNAGSGGAFNGLTVGAFGLGFGTGSVSGWGMYGASGSDHLNGTGVVGLGNTLFPATLPRTLSAGSGGAFTGQSVGAFGFSNTSAGANSGYGLYGASNHNLGTGVVGIGNNLFAANVIPAVAAAGSGGAFTGNTIGAYGHALANNGIGVEGYAASSNSGTGVAGAGNNLLPTLLNDGGGGSFTGFNTGVFGIATNINGGGISTANGVFGQSEGAFDLATGVFGLSNGSVGSTYGVRGTSISSSNGAAGVYGLSASVTTNYTYGVLGYTLSANTNTSGVIGISSDDDTGTGVIGLGNNSLPITLINGAGVAGTGKVTGTAGVATASTGDRYGGYFGVSAGTGSDFNVVVGANVGGTQYKILGSAGTVSTAVPDDAGNRRIMFCTEAPEVLLEDYGMGRLVNGKASIQIDPIFSKNIKVDGNHPLRVFIQLEGDCKGVYVTDKNASGFTVKELENGQSNVNFMWHIVANRTDEYSSTNELISKYQDLRFPIAPDLKAASIVNPKPYIPQDTTDYLAKQYKVENNHTTYPAIRPATIENPELYQPAPPVKRNLHKKTF